MKLVMTCEHAGNEVPVAYKNLFVGAEDVLQTHRGYDPGAFHLFENLKILADYSHFTSISRLIIEVNRSLDHPGLFSEFASALPAKEKKELIATFYSPYRKSVEEKISRFIADGEKVWHFSIHSFTPILNEQKRNADVGLLYDPARPAEKELCKKLKENIQAHTPAFNVRFNYPYLGKADGFTTWLRRKFPEGYLGIEVEVNQEFSSHNRMDGTIKAALFDAVLRAKK